MGGWVGQGQAWQAEIDRPNVEPIIYTDEFTWWRRSLYHVRYRGHRQEGRARV